MVCGQVAEQAYFFLEMRLDIFFAAADDNFGVNAELVQIADGHLCGLGFLFVYAGGYRNVGEVHKNGVVVADFVTQLSSRLDVELVFEVAHGSTDFDEQYIGLLLVRNSVKLFLDEVGYVRDELHRMSEVITVALFLENHLENAAHREAPILLGRYVQKAFVVAEVHVAFAAVVQNKNFAVFCRVHCAWVGVQVTVAFDGNDLHSSRKQRPDGRCCYSFAESGDDASGDDDKFCPSVVLVL